MRARSRTYATARSRWEGIGPYFAMFPTWFADRVIKRYTSEGDGVLDPFAGRGTAVFSASASSRIGLGIELNEVGWVYARTKLRPAPAVPVIEAVLRLGRLADKYCNEAAAAPSFFRQCFSPGVLRFLLAARDQLNWRRCGVDRTVMAFLLVYLHGKRDASLSNQMRQTKAMSPDYAIRWWRAANLRPPELDPVEFVIKRICWRYAKGMPYDSASRMYLGDSTVTLPRLRSRAARFKLLLTSPPYFGVTNYHYDQWLRRWLLGGPPNALRVPGRYRRKFEGHEQYERLLRAVFERAQPLLHPKAVVYVRTDRREFCRTTTLAVLRSVFRRKHLGVRNRPFPGPTQTHLFGDDSPKLGEVDIVMTP